MALLVMSTITLQSAMGDILFYYETAVLAAAVNNQNKPIELHYKENEALNANYSQSFACIDAEYQTYYELMFDADMSAKVYLSAGSLHETGTYSTNGSNLGLNLNLYGSDFTSTYHLTINNEIIALFTGIERTYPVSCIAYKHNLTDKVQTATQIECLSSYRGGGNSSSEFYKKIFTLNPDGSSSYYYKNELYTSLVEGTLYGTYFLDSSTGGFQLSYMDIDGQTFDTDIISFYGRNDGASLNMDIVDPSGTGQLMSCGIVE
ncbi:MAG: hypothetical protein U9O64_02590 [Campylobacterota bacterium]|nr:hypothetical protein [Campylobacterota bacterium]